MNDDREASGYGWFDVVVGNGNVNAGIGRLLLLVIVFIVVFGTTMWAIWPN